MRALLWLALAVAPVAGAQTVNDTYDRTTGERIVAYTADGSRDSARPVFTFAATFNGGVVSAAINLAFVTSGEGVSAARFSGCHDIQWNADGRSVATGPAAHRAQVIDGDRVEMIEQDVPADWVAALGEAQAVSYRVCRETYTLSSSDLDAFMIIAAKYKSAGLSSVAPAGTAPAPAETGEVEYKGMNWRPKHPGSLFRGGN